MKQYLPSLLLLSLTSCALSEEPISTSKPDNNHTYKVEYLFEHDGCKVYRFHDYGKYVYFTTCNGEAIVKRDSASEIRNVTVMKKGY